MSRNQKISVALLACCAAFFLAFFGQRLLASPSAKFAVVDLTSIMASMQELSIKAIADINTPPEVRSRAVESAKQFGTQVGAATAELSLQCGCVVLMKEAVVSGDLPDLTAELVAKLKAR